jgi:taurine dioxygenase
MVTVTSPGAPFDWRPINPAFGAELTIGQLHELDDSGVGALAQLLGDRGVIVARDQAMTTDDQIGFGRRLGPLYVHPAFADATRPEMIVLHADERTTRAAGEAWHSDISCEDRPPAASVLRMEVVPDCGGDTLFADMYQAYESLSPAMRQFLTTLTARHDPPAAYYTDRLQGEPPSSVHPVVRTHPLSARRALYVNSGYTTRILELSERESDALLRMLFDHIAYNVQHQLRVRWQPGTTVLWDNRCVQHHAAFDYFPAVRHGYRVTTIGEVPVL